MSGTRDLRTIDKSLANMEINIQELQKRFEQLNKLQEQWDSWKAGLIAGTLSLGPKPGMLTRNRPPEEMIDGKLTIRDDQLLSKTEAEVTSAGLAFRDAQGHAALNFAAATRVLLFSDGAGGPTINLNGGEASLALGGDTEHGRIAVRHAGHQDTVTIDGGTGSIVATRVAVADDIVLTNADCAEEFDVAEGLPGDEPGAVVVLDDDGRVRPGDAPYDRRVAGVVSGAGAYRPGLILDRRPTAARRAPIALVGKVYCKADAGYGPIAVGDLLTTSATPGHAMRADDRLRAFGAVLGKALRPLPAGRGLIPIFVALQ